MTSNASSPGVTFSTVHNDKSLMDESLALQTRHLGSIADIIGVVS